MCKNQVAYVYLIGIVYTGTEWPTFTLKVSYTEEPSGLHLLYRYLIHCNLVAYVYLKGILYTGTQWPTLTL